MVAAMYGVAIGLAIFSAGGRAPVTAEPRIVWEGEVVPAFKKALKDKKLLVVYFHKDYCHDCRGPCKHCGPVNEILGGERAGALAGGAVWVWQTVGIDDDKKNVAKLMRELRVDRVPTLVVLDVSATELREKGRIVGKYDADKYLKMLRELLGDTPEPATPAAVPAKSP